MWREVDITLVSNTQDGLWLQVSQKDATKVMAWFWTTIPGASYRNWANCSPSSRSRGREQAMNQATVPRDTHLTPSPLYQSPLPQ